MLTYTEARDFYDRFGARQDAQARYEDPAIIELLQYADFSRAASVFELGYGTGRLAHYLLTDVLPTTTHYHGVDVSATMMRLARERLAAFGERAKLALSDGRPKFALPDHSLDHFISTYVLDLLTPEDMAGVLSEAHRLLRPNGQLCLVSLTHGLSGWPRLVSWGWERIHAIWPARFGGCRPIRLSDYLTPAHWQIQHHARVTASDITSEIMLARPAPMIHEEG